MALQIDNVKIFDDDTPKDGTYCRPEYMHISKKRVILIDNETGVKSLSWKYLLTASLSMYTSESIANTIESSDQPFKIEMIDRELTESEFNLFFNLLYSEVKKDERFSACIEV